MTTTKESGVEIKKSPPKDKKSPAKKRQKLTNSDGPDPESFDVVHREFTEAIDLTSISEKMKQKMYAVAPALLGTDAVYTSEFFTDVVKLCGTGVLLAKLQGFEDEIHVKWPVKDHRYLIAECLDSNEAVSFVNQYSKVYGGSPDNDYFPLRFLRGCYATFVHNIDVNWAKEALDRRHTRQMKPEKNPQKLGPIALRQQVEALCKLVAGTESKPDLGMKSLAAAKDELQQCQEDEVKAKNLKRRLLKKLKDAKEGLEGCYADEESNDLNVRYSKTVAEAKTLRTTGTAKEASAKRAEAEALLAAINESSVKTKKFEDTIEEIQEELLLKAMAELKSANESVEKAEERVKELTTCPGCKDAMAKTLNPADRAPSADPRSPSNALANVELPSPPNAVADALPASSRNSAIDGGLEPAVGCLPADALCQCTDSLD